MVVLAWYMVAEYNLRLGPSNTKDNLEEAVRYLYKDLYQEKVPSTVKKDELRTILLNEKNRKYFNFKDKLTNNVPYCLQSPFYDPKNKLL